MRSATLRSSSTPDRTLGALRPRRARKTAGVPRARRLRSLAGGAVLIALLAGLAFVLWPSSLGGCSTLTVVSGQSMEPTYSTGDLVWSRCGEPSVGDIVVYSPADTDGAHVIHRIVGGDSEAGWVLQGDNNDFLDPWNPDDSQIVGIATVHIPGLGNVLYSLGSPYIWASLLILAAAFFLWPQSPAVTAPDHQASYNQASDNQAPDNQASYNAAARDPEGEPAPATEPLPVHQEGVLH